MLSIGDRFKNLGVMIGVGILSAVLANTGLFADAVGTLGPAGLAAGAGVAALVGGLAQFLLDMLKKEEKI